MTTSLPYAGPGTRIAKRPLPRYVSNLVWTLCLASLLCFTVPLFFPFCSNTSGEIICLKPNLRVTLPWVVVAGAGFPSIAGVLLLFQKRVLWGTVLTGSLLPLVFVAISLVSLMWLSSDGAVRSRITAPDGKEYVFFEWFSFNSMYTLAHVKSSTACYDVYEPLGHAFEKYSKVLPVVRPDPPKFPADHALYLAPDGTIAGLSERNQCYFVFEPRTSTFYCDESITSLSPFLLLDAATAPYLSDLASLRAEPDMISTPNLEAALAHPNPAVAKLAAELLEARRP